MESTNAKKEYFKKHHVQCFNIWTNIENISKTPIKNPKKLFLKSWKCVYTSSFEKLFQRWKVVDAFNFEKSWVFKVKSTLMYGFGFNDEISTLIKLFKYWSTLQLDFNHSPTEKQRCLPTESLPCLCSLHFIGSWF